jgi:quinoprotein glucose dehydrogenase
MAPRRWFAPLGTFVLLVAATGAQSRRPMVEWGTYAGDLRGTRYSSLSQINADNFNRLDVAWRFKTDNLGPRPEYNLQATPLMVGGVIYSTGGSRRAVVALNAETGELLWVFSLDEGRRGDTAPRRQSGRGLAYWSNGTDQRIIFVTPGYQMIALDAKTGSRITGFGKTGIVDLKLDDDQQMDLVTGEVGFSAAPIISNDTVVIGAAHAASFTPKTFRNEKGFVRAYDVRTGKRLWIFHTIPTPGEPGNETWKDDSWSYTGNTGVWSQITIDEDLGIVYLPVEAPTGDYYGGHRHGANLFGSSLVALNLRTGKRIWHYQFVHHDIWDWDIPCAPILVDITVAGKAIKAVAQPTKQGWVYVFDRVTGTPVWPIEERPVPQSEVPGEETSPTQPFVTKPPAFERQGIGVDDLIDFTPELRTEALKAASRYKMGPLFNPPVASRVEEPLGALVLPAVNGGANWPGGSVDPETNILYVFSNTQVSNVGLVHDPQRSEMQYIEGSASGSGPTAAAAGYEGGGLTVQGLPLVKPPWGRITAIDLNKGELVWQIPHGETPDVVRNHPMLRGLHLARTGRPGRIGVLTTKTLVIAGEGGFFTTPSGQRGAMLRAYDKKTGDEVGAVYMAAPETGSPMTYLLNGRQYIVVAISGGSYSGELLAFRLPPS